MRTKTTRLEVLLDEETVNHLDRLESVWNVSRAQVVRKSVALAVAALANPRGRTEVAEAPMRPEPVTVVEARRPAVPAMLTGRQLALQQARDRERRRGDETDQSGGEDL